MRSVLRLILAGYIGLFVAAFPVFAQMDVQPTSVAVSQTVTFMVNVSTDRNVPTVGLRLLIPKGVKNVTPNVKPGWTITTKKKGAIVTEIDWSGGNIPPEERDTFLFQAQVPATATIIQWKAYQQFQDGTTVAWGNPPTKKSKSNAFAPYSRTVVINNLTNNQTMESPTEISHAIELSVIAFALSVFALGLAMRKR